jgi:hypothetical protein
MNSTNAGLRNRNHDPGREAPLIPSFNSHSHTHSNAGGDLEEIAKLQIENARLQQIVAELLIANQQLRRRITEAGGAPDHHGGATSHNPIPTTVESRGANGSPFTGREGW